MVSVNEMQAGTTVPPELRRAFDLPEEDQDFLINSGYTWETLSGGWLLIHGFRIPPGYNVAQATIVLLIPTSYPATQIDMMSFMPSLLRQDGVDIKALITQHVDGQTLQCWSRHRPLTGPGAWRSNIDNVESHLLAVDDWLVKELSR